MNEKKYDLPDGKTAVFYYDDDGIGKIALECMDMLMEKVCGQWVSVNEILPEMVHEREIVYGEFDDEPVWCMDSNPVVVRSFEGGYAVCVLRKDSDGVPFWYNLDCDIGDQCEIGEIQAWMPLPTPFFDPTCEEEKR